ncbi:MAG: GNAT family N-acetyltransferase [Candidatus Eisenbacteria bacterium]|uniref:GNAT family N-acetyltransferase n=1 Tax=Eiseniibacteriota bacterium TaxID=2212470 RepID=A0A849SQE1_UNCEI|nr:GNAT family N-acetyltransferase [Candidatus Eisenbacteria bacterium]
MAVTIRPYLATDLETLRALIAAPEIVEQFDAFAAPGALEQKFADPHLAASCVRLAFEDERPIGFALAWLLPQAPIGWAMVRGGVLEFARRRGIATRLVEAVFAAIEAHPGAARIRDVTGAAWLPAPAAEALAKRLGARFDRAFWMMERPLEAPAPIVEWPSGIATRSFDGTMPMAKDWNDVYLESFAQHWRFVPSSLDETLELTRGPRFDPADLRLAYRGAACVGFCRLERHANRGEIAVLGTAPAARGIGLGRALLRWGVARLQAGSTQPITLIVDGANENALRLYRSEGFSVMRTRHVWVRPPRF